MVKLLEKLMQIQMREHFLLPQLVFSCTATPVSSLHRLAPLAGILVIQHTFWLQSCGGFPAHVGISWVTPVLCTEYVLCLSVYTRRYPR